MEVRAYRKWASFIGIAFCILLCCGLGGCLGRGTDQVKQVESGSKPESTIEKGDHHSYIENELVGIFETEADAQAAAELYGIELTSYSNQIAVFTCDGDPRALIEQGEKNGWPQLSLNRIYTAHGEKDSGDKKGARDNNR